MSKRIINCSTGEAFNSYRAYLTSNHWKKIKHLYSMKFPYECGICESKFRLDLHHVTYERIGNEDLTDLVYLCRSCHNSTHDSKDDLPEINSFIRKTIEENKKKEKKPSNRDEFVVYVCPDCHHKTSEPPKTTKGVFYCPRCIVTKSKIIPVNKTKSYRPKVEMKNPDRSQKRSHKKKNKKTAAKKRKESL